MGLFSSKTDISSYERAVERAKAQVEHHQREKEAAKRSGNYQRMPKQYRGMDGVSRNLIDDKIYLAKEELKARKQALADAKRRAKSK